MLLAWLAIGWGCKGQSDCDPTTESCPDENQAYEGAWYVDGFEATCATEGWTYAVSAAGVPETVLLDVQRTGAGEGKRVDEFHSLVLNDANEDGYWSKWDRVLPIIDVVSDWTSDENTLFTCADDGLLSFRVALVDFNGDEAGCWAIGDDPGVFAPCEVFE